MILTLEGSPSAKRPDQPRSFDQPAGEHFSQKNHTTMDMIFLPIERVLPARDAALRKTREKVWIRHYDSTTFGKNTRT